MLVVWRALERLVLLLVLVLLLALERLDGGVGGDLGPEILLVAEVQIIVVLGLVFFLPESRHVLGSGKNELRFLSRLLHLALISNLRGRRA